jgi:hypothetical protein
MECQNGCRCRMDVLTPRSRGGFGKNTTPFRAWAFAWPVLAFAMFVLQSPTVAALERNAGKYGAMFSWWYEDLPPTTLYPPRVPWNAQDPNWWTAIVTAARDAGLGWVAPGCWGEDTTADPIQLGPLLTAIDRTAPNLKVALFDDTTSEVLRKNRARNHGWVLDVPFDLSDLAGAGEGGVEYFYDQQWKRFFQTVPARYRLTIDGRPVVFMWHGGAEWYTRQNFFHAMIDALRQATRRDFGVDPYVIVEESWLRLDPATGVDALFDWFEPRRNFATLMNRNGVRVGHLVPGYDCSRCGGSGPVIPRQAGALYRAGLEAVAPSADLVLIEGLDNVDENAHILETAEWGRWYLSITRWFSSNIP